MRVPRSLECISRSRLSCAGHSGGESAPRLMPAESHQHSIRSLKSGEAAGVDEFRLELLKALLTESDSLS